MSEDSAGRADVRRYPRHVAIIMDGNGRWAAARGKPRSDGHRAGVEAARRIVRAARDLDLKALTLYSFSTENWRRPRQEVELLLRLLQGFVRDDLKELVEGGVRVRVVGSRDGLEPTLLRGIQEAERQSAINSKFHLNIAFNYGSRDEILRAVRAIAEKCADGLLTADGITEDTMDAHLDTHGLPPLDLIIRTSGEYRLSNFLLWQSAYAEFVFDEVYWPDYDAERLKFAIDEYTSRDRRFGGLSSPGEVSETDIAT